MLTHCTDLVYGKGWGLYALWASIGLISYVYALSGSTTYYYAQFATSAYGEHTIIGTIGVITQIMNGVAQPFIAKVSSQLEQTFVPRLTF